MNKRGQGAIVSIAIGAIILVVILGAIFTFLADNSLNVQTVNNETLALNNKLQVISNESVTISAETGVVTGNMANNGLTVLTALRNWTSENIRGFCNVTLNTGAIKCNTTGNTTAFADYTFIMGREDTLANDDLTSLSAARNESSQNIINQCNITLATGDLVCNNTKSAIAYVDYSYQPTGFITSGITRTIVGLITVLLGLAILIFIIGVGRKS